MSAVPTQKLTVDEYLAIERAAEFKSEFFDGVMYPLQGPGGPLGMAGAKFDHNRIKENLSFELTKALKGGPCQSLSSDMRVRVSATGLHTYPDLLVVCGEPEFADDKRDTLLNPIIIIEVLSPSTERYNRGAKFRQYQKIPSLKEIVLVAQDEPLAERFVRQADESWALIATTGLDGTFAFHSIPVTLPMAAIYDGVTFPDGTLQ
ncbi:MAG: Uma2 family endonuclease [Gemmataceae bacterium]